jgi:hypothetical protein
MSLVNGDINEDGGIYGGIPAKPRIRRAQII